MRYLLTLAVLFYALNASAQLAEGAFHVGWTTTKPLSDKNYVSGTTSRGLRFGYTKFINERFGFGGEGFFTSLDKYVPRQTYYYDGGAITTDLYNYLYYFTLGGHGQYYFRKSGLLIPFASLGAGVSYTQYKLFYNVYSDHDSRTAFYMRPEVGAMLRFKKYGSLGLKTTIGYEYTNNKSQSFDVKNFTAMNFQIGFVLLTD